MSSGVDGRWTTVNIRNCCVLPAITTERNRQHFPVSAKSISTRLAAVPYGFSEHRDDVRPGLVNPEAGAIKYVPVGIIAVADLVADAKSGLAAAPHDVDPGKSARMTNDGHVSAGRFGSIDLGG